MAIIVNGHRIIVSKDIFVVHNGLQMGPYDEAEVRNLQLAGSVDLTDPAWREGLEDWVPLAKVLERGPVPPPQPNPSSWSHTLAMRDLANRRARLKGPSPEKKRVPVQLEDDFEHDPSWEILSQAWKKGLFLGKLLLQTMVILVLWETTFLIIHPFLPMISRGGAMPSTTYVWLPLALLASGQIFFLARFFASLAPCFSAAFCLAVDFAIFVHHNDYSGLWVSSFGWLQDPQRHAFQGMGCGLLSLVLLVLAAGLGRGLRLNVGRWPWMR